MLDVIGTVEHVVTTKMMDGITFAKIANVFVSRWFFNYSITISSKKIIVIFSAFLWKISIQILEPCGSALNNYCDDETNNAECNWDGGACCNNQNDGWDTHCTECKCLGKQTIFSCITVCFSIVMHFSESNSIDVKDSFSFFSFFIKLTLLLE